MDMTFVDIGFWGKGLPAAVLLLCGFVVCLGLAALKLQAERGRKVLLQARRVMFAAVGFVVIALLLLTAAFLTDDFSVAAVAAYSSAGLGFFYKLSAVWDGNVYPDQFWRNYSLGNVRDKSFNQIWEDSSEPALKRLRDKAQFADQRCLGCRWFDLCKGNLRFLGTEIEAEQWLNEPACYLTDDEISLQTVRMPVRVDPEK